MDQRMDPRRRQAALSFLTNISLDGRPLQANGVAKEGSACSLVEKDATLAASPLHQIHASLSKMGLSSPSGPLPISMGGRRELMEHEMQKNHFSEYDEEEEDEDAFTSSVPASAGVGVPAQIPCLGSRGRLNSLTSAILPAAFCRTSATPIFSCSDQIQSGTSSAFDIQRSR